MGSSPSEDIARARQQLDAALTRIRELCGSELAPGFEANMTQTPDKLTELREKFQSLSQLAKKAGQETRDRIANEIRARYAAAGKPCPLDEKPLEPIDT